MRWRTNGEGSIYATIQKVKRKKFDTRGECAICKECTDRTLCNNRIGHIKCDKCKNCKSLYFKLLFLKRKVKKNLYRKFKCKIKKPRRAVALNCYWDQNFTPRYWVKTNRTVAIARISATAYPINRISAFLSLAILLTTDIINDQKTNRAIAVKNGCVISLFLLNFIILLLYNNFT